MLRQIEAPAGHESLYELRQPAIGLRAFIALHSTARGPAFGGIRRYAYESREQALADVLALSEAMSLKCAIAGLDAGGAKSVIIDDPALDVVAAYEAMGRAVQSLEGAYVCGPDVGTGPEHLDAIRTHTRWVNPVENDAGVSTAAGVLSALRGALGNDTSESAFSGLRVAIEGLGSVGGSMARTLVESGAQVFGFDIDAAKMRRAEEAGVELAVSGDALREVHVDVWMPCALGGSVDERLIEPKRARTICGSANNQLSAPEMDRRLFDAGVEWVPDFVANVGAVAEGVITVTRGQDEDARAAVDECLAGVEDTTRHLLARARDAGRPTGEVALEAARDRLAGA